jgi:hypothetical protein
MTKSWFGHNIRNGVIVQGGFVGAGDGSREWNPHDWLREFVKREIVDEAPEDSAICEFDCRKVQCAQAEWAACERRIRKGAGELFPISPKA